MKRLILVAGLILPAGHAVSAENDFLLQGEEIRSARIGQTTVVVLEDFLKNSFEGARVIGIEVEGPYQYLLVERNDELAVLLPEALFNTRYSHMTVSFVDTCQQECAGAAIGGALTGAVAGATSGASAGGTIGTAGGPPGISAGAAGGAVIGGVGGGITGWEGCKLITDCENTPPPPEVKSEKGAKSEDGEEGDPK